MARKRDNMVLAAAKVACRVLYERATGMQPQTLADVPRSARAITPEWMSLVMCKGHPGTKVLAVTKIGGDDGTHERCRLALTYNEAGQSAGLPKTVFTKTLPSVATRMLAGYMGHARFEMLFYTTVRPELDIETPLCYHSASDKVSLAAIHVLEDLAETRGASFGDETTVLSRAQAETLVDLLAELHGSYYDSPRFKTDLRWLVDYWTWYTKGAERVHYERYTEKALTKAAHVIPTALMARRAEIWPATLRGLDIHASGPMTIIHSDVHIGNSYLTRAGRVGFFDWQCVNRGHWSRDLSYALSSCLTIEHRRAWECDLLRRYLERLEERSGRRFDFDSSWKLYRQQMLHALTQWTQTLCHPIFVPHSQRDALTFEQLKRITTAVADLDSLDSFDTRASVPGYARAEAA